MGSDQFGATIMVSGTMGNVNSTQAVILRLSNIEVRPTFPCQSIQICLNCASRSLTVAKLSVSVDIQSTSTWTETWAHRTLNHHRSIKHSIELWTSMPVTSSPSRTTSSITSCMSEKLIRIFREPCQIAIWFRGGAMFLEDGVEVGNVFRGNLAVFVRTSSSLLNEDVTPAAFWVWRHRSYCCWSRVTVLRLLLQDHQSQQHRGKQCCSWRYSLRLLVPNACYSRWALILQLPELLSIPTTNGSILE